MEEDDFYYAPTNYYFVRYQSRETKNTEFVKVFGRNEEAALGTFKRLISDYVDGTPIVLNEEEYREIRENLGLNPNGIDESEMPPSLKKFMEIHNSKEWRSYYASGGYDDY